MRAEPGMSNVRPREGKAPAIGRWTNIQDAGTAIDVYCALTVSGAEATSASPG